MHEALTSHHVISLFGIGQNNKLKNQSPKHFMTWSFKLNNILNTFYHYFMRRAVEDAPKMLRKCVENTGLLLKFILWIWFLWNGNLQGGLTVSLQRNTEYTIQGNTYIGVFT